MTLQTPTWLQNGTYSAKEDRALIDATYREGVLDPASGSMAVSQRAAGANNTVDIASGLAVIQGDDEAEQGKYLVRNVGIVNLSVAAAPASNSRIDLVYLKVNDPTAGGASGDNAVFAIAQGTAAASPTAPTLPVSAIPLAQILRVAGDTSVTTARITDVRTEASFVPAVFTNAKLTSVREPFTTSATAATGTINMDCGTTTALLYTSNASGNWTLNLRASASAALTTIVGVGESITVTFAAQQPGSSAKYMTAFQIDGNAVTPKYQDGIAPAAGIISVIDCYTFTCIRTGASSWTVLASRVVYA